MSLDIEITTWDEERIKDEIILRLEPGWVFGAGPSDDRMSWEASISDQNGEPIWYRSEMTLQLVLLDALGWLENRKYQVSETSNWVRRRGDLNPQRVHEIAYSKSFGPPDPPHLDVIEIDSIVRSARKAK